MNNTFNLAYEILAWKIHKALVKAKLEPYLGFLHSNQMAKLSLVCDFQELYRYLIDDFLIGYCQLISKKDFKMKTELASHGKMGKREYLTDSETRFFSMNLIGFSSHGLRLSGLGTGSTRRLRR